MKRSLLNTIIVSSLLVSTGSAIAAPDIAAPVPVGSGWTANPENKIWADSVNDAIQNHADEITRLDRSIRRKYRR